MSTRKINCKNCGTETYESDGICLLCKTDTPERVCKQCGKVFSAEHKLQKYCSEECRKEAKRQWDREHRKKDKKKLKEIVNKYVFNEAERIIIRKQDDNRFLVTVEGARGHLYSFFVSQVLKEQIIREAVEI